MPMITSSLRSLADERDSDRDFIYLLMLARKYDLKPVALHNALVKARENEKSTCGSLSIESRILENNGFSFMFSRDDQAVAQTAISEHSLAKLRSLPQEIVQLLKNRNPKPTLAGNSEADRRIADLQIGLRHVNLKAKVIGKSKIRAVQSRDGLPLLVCSATVSDGTGKIKLPLWNRQIHSVVKNDTVIIREAIVRNFRGEMQLSVPRKNGSISIVHSAE